MRNPSPNEPPWLWVAPCYARFARLHWPTGLQNSCKRLFSHLAIEEALPPVCSWTVDSIMLTRIGRSARPDSQLQRGVAALCPRASAAYDGLAVTV